MAVRHDVVIFAVLLLGSAAAVVSQIDHDPIPKAARDRPPIGSKVPDFRLKDIGGAERTLSEFMKDKKATVLYFWDVACPCIDAVQMRLQKAQDRYEKLGVAFVGIDSQPSDTRDQVFEKMARIRTAHVMLLDPEQVVLPSTGIGAAAQVVVLDPEGAMRYRGSIDDDLTKPKVDFLGAALDAILEGRDVSPKESAKSYGCPYENFEGFCEEEAKQKK